MFKQPYPEGLQACTVLLITFVFDNAALMHILPIQHDSFLTNNQMKQNHNPSSQIWCFGMRYDQEHTPIYLMCITGEGREKHPYPIFIFN
jgi:hypothetical protein